ncbi:unnamed protein product, partial [marine sediment metagenome]
RLCPSENAHSSISLGTLSMNPFNNQIVRGRLNKVWDRITASTVSYNPIVL